MTSLVRISTAEAVVNHFKDRLSSGTLRPGDRLPSERILQEELGISRFALREGLARLNALGIISSTQGRASIINGEVNARSLGDVFIPQASGDRCQYQDDLFATRRLLEVECAGLAAARCDRDQAARLQFLLQELATAIDDGPAYAQHDQNLHHAIVVVAGNRFLERIHAVLQDQLQPLIHHSVGQPSHRRISMAGHRALLRAIVAGNVVAARKHMTSHLAACRTAYHRNQS